MSNPSALDLAVQKLGHAATARACGVSPRAVRKWQAAGRLPRTEWTGETDYAGRIERASGGAVTREALLALPPRPAPAPALQQAPCA
jgi:DNA-binding transcriptional regulator YdaS (Cro superfamily)